MYTVFSLGGVPIRLTEERWKEHILLRHPELENALDFGEFIPYDRSWDFVQTLEDAKHKVDALVKDGQAERAVSLYEIFLSGCYEKVNEIDDSGGDLGMFFQNLFCSWITARQKAKYDPAETVQNILGWMDNDEYGFC